MRLVLDQDILFLVPESAEERAEIDTLATRAVRKELTAWTIDGALLLRIQSLPPGLRSDSSGDRGGQRLPLNQLTLSGVGCSQALPLDPGPPDGR